MAHNRRKFLKAAGGAALSGPFFARRIQGANGKVNVAFIGAGRTGSRNIGYAAQVPGIHIMAVCDVDQPSMQRAKALAQRLGFGGVNARNDFREILADPSIDAVCISTPDRWQAFLTVETCKAGKDVYVEHPAFVYIDEGPKIVEAARKYRRVVQAGTRRRSGSIFQAARQIVKSGQLGNITFIRIFQPGPTPGLSGAGVHWGVDQIDLVQFAFDEEMPVSIAAQGGKFYGSDDVRTPDTFMVTYRYPNFINWYESRRANSNGRNDGCCGTAFHGTQGTLIVNGGGYRIFRNGDGETAEEHSEGMSSIGAAHWKNFLDCVKTRERPVSDIETCVRSTATCVLGNLALRHGVTLDWDDRAFTVKQQEMKSYLKFTSALPETCRFEI